ncbi:putative glycosyltransferase YibD [Enterobacter sp. DC1]|uniref:glycosyltransferase n=1 Tax=Enterobacter TaxID=547 RepID=UPI0003ECE3F1|nr:glycosyltransferase family 2 protein [Enterobacter sp. DC1]ELP5713447.1 glycosyltransferase [Enterobacter asburiae]EMA4736451.1 glycosyltransferase [Enterobacter asburiae]EWG70289.1 putative glycosyltransferase YibD [Enterobacter sp. DC1]
MQYNDKISIVVPAYCEPSKVKRFMDTILNIDYPDNLIELILIDDCSPVSLEEIAASYGEAFKDKINFSFHRNQVNSGRAISRNVGISLATNSLIMFIDIDNLLEPDAIKKIVSFFHGKHFTAARINIRIDPARLSTSNYLRYFDSRYLGARNIPEGVISTRFFASDGIILTRDIINTIGGFDETFYHYGCEDEELGIRVSKAKYDFYFLPDAKAEDSDTPTLRRASERMVVYASKSFPVLKEKHPECVKDSLFSSYEVMLDDTRLPSKLLIKVVHLLPHTTTRKSLLWLCDKLDAKAIKIPDFIYKIVLALSYIEGGRLRQLRM